MDKCLYLSTDRSHLNSDRVSHNIPVLPTMQNIKEVQKNILPVVMFDPKISANFLTICGAKVIIICIFSPYFDEFYVKLCDPPG